MSAVVLSLQQFDQLLSHLRDDGYRLLGPRIDNNTIAYGGIESVADLPKGISDEQEPGCYRLKQRSDDAVFQFNTASNTWRTFLHPPEQPLLSVKRDELSVRFEPPQQNSERLALIGVRGCELNAIARQDKVLMDGAHIDTDYAGRRAGVFVVAVNCTHTGATCFCASMRTGPTAEGRFDLAVTELLEGDHRFLVRCVSEPGERMLELIESTPATRVDLDQETDCIRAAEAALTRTMRSDARDALLSNQDSPYWEEIADRCLACGNCTMSCPTCFCTETIDESAFDGMTATRKRVWDSCFNAGFTYMSGGVIRASVASRYRHWITHKLATWHDQFGSSGCVGCGHCITWCPVKIDITEEVAVLAARAEKSID